MCSCYSHSQTPDAENNTMHAAHRALQPSTSPQILLYIIPSTTRNQQQPNNQTSSSSKQILSPSCLSELLIRPQRHEITLGRLFVKLLETARPWISKHKNSSKHQQTPLMLQHSRTHTAHGASAACGRSAFGPRAVARPAVRHGGCAGLQLGLAVTTPGQHARMDCHHPARPHAQRMDACAWSVVTGSHLSKAPSLPRLVHTQALLCPHSCQHGLCVQYACIHSD